jgi:hypothetical protein
MNQHITLLDLPKRLQKALQEAGYSTTHSLINMNTRTRIPGVGRKSMETIRQTLIQRGLVPPTWGTEISARTEENLAQTEETTPPQVGAPVTRGHSGSVAPATTHVATVVHKKATRCYCMASARVYAVVVVPRPGGSRILVVEVVGERIITCQQVPPSVREFATRPPRHVGIIYVGVQIRSFLGLVNTFVPVFTVDVSDREMWSAEDVTSVMSPQLTKHIMDALFN